MALFQQPELEKHWNNAASPTHPDYEAALNFWASNKETLPGPIFFTLLPHELLQGKWQRVVRQSEDLCDCGVRRWFLPEHSQHYHSPATITPITIGAGNQLALGPWGGDKQSTQQQLSVENGLLIARNLPYSQESRDKLAAMGLMAVEFDHQQQEPIGPPQSGDIVTEPLTKFAEQFEEGDTPIQMTIGLRVARTRQGIEIILWALYAVYAVDLEANTMAVVPSTTVKVIDRASHGLFHRCE